jgi:hypothetical protein
MAHQPHRPLPLRKPEAGPVLEYLKWVSVNVDEARAKLAYQAVSETLNSPGGAILLDLLEKALQFSVFPITENPSALVARNAQCFIVSDLRRIAANEMGTVQQPEDDTKRTGRRSGGSPDR